MRLSFSTTGNLRALLGKTLSSSLRRGYNRAVGKVNELESKLPTIEKRGLRSSSLAGGVLAARILQNLYEFLMIVFLDPAESFNFLKKRDEFAVCTTSYVEYRLYSRKLRLLSVGGITAVVMASLAVSLITSYIFPRFETLAATFTFTQTGWDGGATTTTANHTSNRTGWTYFDSKDVSVTNTATSVTGSASISKIETSDTDFSSGTLSLISVSGTGSGASVRLLIAE